MDMREFGRTGMHLSVLGFGCGAVGGLMVRGNPLDQARTIASAIAAGVNYFDTAVLYGNGESEKNLGRALRDLKATNVVVGTKVLVPSEQFGRTRSPSRAATDLRWRATVTSGLVGTASLPEGTRPSPETDVSVAFKRSDLQKCVV